MSVVITGATGHLRQLIDRPTTSLHDAVAAALR